MFAFFNSLPSVRRFFLFMLMALSTGCGRSAGTTPVNESAARDACEAFLNAWKEGQMPEDLQPAIHGADYVWSSGKKLISYEILPAETNHGTSLRISANLTVQDDKGVESKSTANYTVGTSPVVTVIRDE